MWGRLTPTPSKQSSVSQALDDHPKNFLNVGVSQNMGSIVNEHTHYHLATSTHPSVSQILDQANLQSLPQDPENPLLCPQTELGYIPKDPLRRILIEGTYQ